jgi:hypothetical protein
MVPTSANSNRNLAVQRCIIFVDQNPNGEVSIEQAVARRKAEFT